MALSDPRQVFGIHSFTAYSRTTGLPYGIAKILQNSTFNLQGELVENLGGSQKYPWAIEEARITAEINLQLTQVESWMIEIFLGKAPTDTTTPSSSGSVTAITDKKGTSTVAATGIASVAAKSGSEADMKFGKYMVKVVSATTVDVYCSTDLDFNRGTDKTFENDALKITASALTITQSTAVTIPGFGLELTGGAGTIAMTTGDTATFEVMPAYTKKMEVVIGGASDTFPEFGALMYAQQRGNGEMFEIDAYRCKGAGLPIGFAEVAFLNPEIPIKAFYDSTLNGVASIRHVLPS